MPAPTRRASRSARSWSGRVYAVSEPVGAREFGAFFELHIEQGPILEAEEKTIGVVTDGQGQRWYNVTVTGRESHAGTTPMPLRKDALVAAARIVDAVHRIAHDHAPHAVGTVGVLTIAEASRNVIPGRVDFTVDFRHPDDDTLSAMDQALQTAAQAIAAELDVDAEIESIWHFPPVKFDKDCVSAVRKAAEDGGYSWREIVSGAGHDACYTARRAPTSMVFVPCENGISHNEIENATMDDCAAGANVLLARELTPAMPEVPGIREPWPWPTPAARDRRRPPPADPRLPAPAPPPPRQACGQPRG